MKRIQIIDLDGCISDDRWRRHLINPAKIERGQPGWQERFDQYHMVCHLDELVHRDEIVETLFVILTGRPVRYHDQTIKWLNEERLKPLFLIMRNNHDYSPSTILKRRMVEGLLDPNSYALNIEDIVSAIDDREDIVEMYRSEFGLNAKVVRIGEEEHELG